MAGRRAPITVRKPLDAVRSDAATSGMNRALGPIQRARVLERLSRRLMGPLRQLLSEQLSREHRKLVAVWPSYYRRVVR